MYVYMCVDAVCADTAVDDDGVCDDDDECDDDALSLTIFSCEVGSAC